MLGSAVGMGCVGRVVGVRVLSRGMGSGNCWVEGFGCWIEGWGIGCGGGENAGNFKNADCTSFEMGIVG